MPLIVKRVWGVFISVSVLFVDSSGWDIAVMVYNVLFLKELMVWFSVEGLWGVGNDFFCNGRVEEKMVIC